MLSKLTFRACLLFAVMVAVSGCATWQKQKPTKGKKLLSSARMSQDSVVLELVTLHLPLNKRDLDQMIWREIDEQLFDNDARVRLAANGFRIGVLGGAFPPALSEVLEGTKKSERMQQLDNDNQIRVHAKRIQNRRGILHRYLLSDMVIDELHAFTMSDGRLQGRTYPKAQCMLGLQTYPQPDGTVKIQLTPEIEYGETRQRWVGEQGGFRYAAKRDSKRFDSLRVETIIQPGQTLVITNSLEDTGLGKRFFVESDEGGGGKRKIILIRLAQTQLDQLFSPSKKQ